MNADQLTDTAALLFGVSRADLFSTSRVIRIAEARMALAWALRKQEWSLEAIGAYLKRDHTTIIYAIARIERRAELNPRLAEKLKALEQQAPAPPVDWQARMDLLEQRLAAVEALLQEPSS